MDNDKAVGHPNLYSVSFTTSDKVKVGHPLQSVVTLLFQQESTPMTASVNPSGGVSRAEGVV